VGILSEKDVLRLLYEQEYLPGMVSDYMSGEIVTFDIEDDFSNIYDCLVKSTYRRVPILHQGRLAGMITRADLIRAYRERFRSPTSVPAMARSREEFLARDAMTHGLLTVRKDTPLYEVMDILATQHVTGLPVVDDSMHLEGMITEKDVIRCIGDPDAATSMVQDRMTTNVVTFEPTARLCEVCECLIRRNFRRVPILNDGRLVGIVARADIIRKMSAVFKYRATSGNSR
jgi:CBS domain-containing protein